MTDPTTERKDDRWLWDRTGEPDPDVERLEGLLSPLRHREGAVPALPTAARRSGRSWRPLVAAAALLVAGGATFAVLSSRGDDRPEIPAIRVVAEGTGEIATGEWVESGAESQVVRFGDVGHVTLDPGSRMRVARAGADHTRFFLERGRLEALVSATARPRFFEVETPAVRCVDLGCRYTLDVDDTGVSRVHVTTGQVAFEVPGREVYVPAGAVCLARPGAGPGTPRFEDAPEALVASLDAYDLARVGSDDRVPSARAFLAAVRDGRDALPAWHLLADPDRRVSKAALETLTARFGAPGDGKEAPQALGREALEAWKEHLEANW